MSEGLCVGYYRALVQTRDSMLISLGLAQPPASYDVVEMMGSAGKVCHEPATDQEWQGLPVVGLQTAPGDATVHLGCGVHAGPRPTGPNRRRTIYVRFDNPRVFDVTEAFETYDQVIPGYGSGALPSVEEMKARAYA